MIQSTIAIEEPTTGGAPTPQLSASISLKMTCRAKGQELELCKNAVQEWEKKTGNTVEIIPLPQSSSESYALTQQLLSTQSSDVDVFQADVTWSSFLHVHVVPLNRYFSKTELSEHFPATIKNNIIGNDLVAIPWYTDVDLLFYRKDLLEKYGERPPTSWEELARIAQKIQDAEHAAGNERLLGYVFRGKSYEGLTCHVVEWIDAFGGEIINPNATENTGAREAFTFCSKLLSTISPVGILTYTEEEVRGVFQLGDAVFAHNWPYMWALVHSEGSPVIGKVGIMVLPKGGESGKPTSVLGGWGLCVSKYSKNQAAAIDLVRWLTRAEEQQKRAIQSSYCPTIMALYKDPDVLAKNPFFEEVFQALQTVVLRPAAYLGRFYPQVSTIISNLAQDVLLKKIPPQEAVERLSKEIAIFQKRALKKEEIKVESAE
jgi:trehalose/maltose transport system substrate-binding protein